MIRQDLRRKGLGRWWFGVYWDPSKPWGYGLRPALRFIAGTWAMKRSARALQPVPMTDAAPLLAATFMTGAQYWHQTVFCAHSLATACEGRVTLRIFDDGTLKPAEAACLRQALPQATLIGADEVRQALERELPRARFPLLRQTRDRMPMLRKFVDLRISSRAWQLYLDSDMLFFQRPDFLIACERQRTSCYMVDVANGYILPPEELNRLAGCLVPLNANAGVVSLRDDEIDWDEIEDWCRQLPTDLREHRLFEQTITSILLARAAAQPAPPADYAMVATPDGLRPPDATLAHYIIRGKYPYLTREWRGYRAGLKACSHSSRSADAKP